MRYTFLLFVCFLQFPLTAQTDVLNGGFEDWNEIHQTPDYWVWGHIVAGFCEGEPIERTTDSHSGNYALLLNNIICTAGEHIGYTYLYYGTYESPSSSPPHDWGIPITILPENLSFYYKFLPSVTDSALASVYLFQYDSLGPWYDKFDTIAFSQEYITDAQNNYTINDISINYINPVDYNKEIYISVLFIIIGSNTETQFLIDDVHLSGNLSVPENSAKNNFFLYPNPAAGQVHITLNDNECVQLTDLNGKEIEMALQKLTENIYSFDISKLEKGMYLVRVRSHFRERTERLILN